MRYLVLICLAALVLLNEPSRTVASPDLPGIGDQVACLDAPPTAAPVDLVAVATYQPTALTDAYTNITWSDPGVLLRDFLSSLRSSRCERLPQASSVQSSGVLLRDFDTTAEANHLLC
jgi:hypothetical protein